MRAILRFFGLLAVIATSGSMSTTAHALCPVGKALGLCPENGTVTPAGCCEGTTARYCSDDGLLCAFDCSELAERSCCIAGLEPGCCDGDLVILDFRDEMGDGNQGSGLLKLNNNTDGTVATYEIGSFWGMSVRCLAGPDPSGYPASASRKGELGIAAFWWWRIGIPRGLQKGQKGIAGLLQAKRGPKEIPVSVPGLRKQNGARVGKMSGFWTSAGEPYLLRKEMSGKMIQNA